MKERLEGVMEMAILSMYICLVSPITIRRDARQSCIFVWLPVVQHVIIILRLADLPQVLEAVVHRVAIEMVELPIRETSVVPNPDGCMVIDKSHLAKMLKAKRNVPIFFVSGHASHGSARLFVHEQSALRVITVVPLDARGQCDQLTLR